MGLHRADTGEAGRHRPDAARVAYVLGPDAPEPFGYDPSIIPGWDSPTGDGFAGWRLDPHRLRVFPGTLLLRGEGELLTWHS